MVQIVWTLNAINDLDAILEYIGLDSEIAAQKFINEIVSKADTLAFHSFKGRPIPEDVSGGYRQILHKSYRIIYRIENVNVFISSIYHQKKLLFKIEN